MTTADDVQVFEYSNGFEAEDGSRRALVTAIDPLILTSFLGSYLNETRRLEGGEAYITDSGGVIVASTKDAERPCRKSCADDGAGAEGSATTETIATSRPRRSRARAGS